jgi:phosphate transport system substrate-binding protein
VKKLFKIVAVTIVVVMLSTMLISCGSKETKEPETKTDSTPAPAPAAPEKTDDDEKSDFNAKSDIAVVSREDGSGTRGAFIEIFGVEEKDESGKKVDRTTEEAIISNSTSVAMTTVAGNLYSIGYVSLGSLNDTVKALQIDGVDATAENVVAGTYKVSRPFNIATKEKISDVAQDFIDFILSDDGQAIVTSSGYVAIKSTGAYTPTNLTGKITVSGSSSVTPVMEKLKEAYVKLNSNVEIEVQQSDSTTGMSDAIKGTSDIGMASREVKESELAEGLVPTVIAIDGIAVIVHNDNPVKSLTKEDVKLIYIGEETSWEKFVS